MCLQNSIGVGQKKENCRKMPHQYGLPGFAQTPPSPPSQHGALLPRIGGGAVVPGSTGGSMTTTTTTATTNVYRPQIEDKKLTKDAMERYMRERNDMVIVILHAKVSMVCPSPHRLRLAFSNFLLTHKIRTTGCPKVLRQRETFLLSATVHLSVRQRLAPSPRRYGAQGRK